MGKHAYLIAANANFKVLALCLRMLDDPRNDIYLLLDAKAKVPAEQKKKLLQAVNYSKCSLLMEKVVNWGGYSQIQAVLDLLRAANNAKEDYEYLHFFQGSDLPIKSQDEIHRYFYEHAGLQFVSIEKKRKTMAENKAWYRHYFCHNRYFRKNKLVKAANFGLVYLQKLLHIRKNTDIDLWQGSALFSITGDCARYLADMEPVIYKRFRHALAADEVFVQSILMASDYREWIKDIEKETTSNARLIDRDRPDGKNSPHVWRRDEVDYILSQPDGVLFARKFDESVDLETAQQIYHRVTKKKDMCV